MKRRYEYIAVDFDGTLCVDRFPEIGAARRRAIRFVQKHARLGSKIILYTCRQDGAVCLDFPKPRDYLSEALRWCDRHDIPVHAVNENPWSSFRCTTEPLGALKPYASLYLDDKAKRV